MPKGVTVQVRPAAPKFFRRKIYGSAAWVQWTQNRQDVDFSEHLTKAPRSFRRSFEQEPAALLKSLQLTST
jgi:hypothetical protein